MVPIPTLPDGFINITLLETLFLIAQPPDPKLVYIMLSVHLGHIQASSPPTEFLASIVAPLSMRMLPPETWSLSPGLVVPMPTLPPVSLMVTLRCAVPCSIASIANLLSEAVGLVTSLIAPCKYASGLFELLENILIVPKPPLDV